MSTALKGSIILEETSTKLVFRLKCEKCGELQSGRINATPVPRGQTKETHFFCTKCGAFNKSLIRGN